MWLAVSKMGPNDPLWQIFILLYSHNLLSVGWTQKLNSNQLNVVEVRESVPRLGYQQMCFLVWWFSFAFSQFTLYGENHLLYPETVLVESDSWWETEATAAWVSWQVDPIVVQSRCDWSWTNTLIAAYGDAEPRGTQPNRIRFLTPEAVR